MTNHVFISYSNADALDFATRLANELDGGYPPIPVWFDKRNLRPGMEWDVQIDDGLKNCKLVLFVMTKDSTNEKSVCKQEWSRALSYKKLIIPLLLQQNVNTPFRLGDRQRIYFTCDFQAGVAQLRRHIAWLDSPEGVLQDYKDRLADAERDIQRAKDEDKPRIQADIEDLNKQIETQQKIIDNPQAAQAQTQKNIETGLEREREPAKPVAGKSSTKFINPPPGIAPTYFQDRLLETEQVIHFLQNDAQRMMTVAGRGGVGKTAMVCRLLKHLESGDLPDGKGKLNVGGIVYLSETGTRRVNFPHLFADLSKLLPTENVNQLEVLYKNPKASVDSKMHALLETFPPEKQIVLLLDNFESVVDAETQKLKDSELDEALRAILHAPHHALKVLITTRIAPKELNLLEPARQRLLTLDEGLDSPYAEQILRQMDEDGKLGLKNAPDSLLQRARERTRGYPRALEALFAILSSDRYTTLEELLSQPTPENVVEALVGEAFSRLDPTAQKVMQALAIYNRPVAPAAVDYLLQPHLPGVDSAPALQRLVNMHFVRRESGRFYLHPVDKDYALGKVPEKQPVTAENVERKEVLDALKQNTFSRHDLLERAADYFKQARKPRAEWKKLDDLAAQLAEFDLRCAAGDYDTAASLIHDIDFNYLLLWGNYRLTLSLYERIYTYISDKFLQKNIIGDMGTTCYYMAQYQDALHYHGIVLKMAEEEKDKLSQAVWVNWMGNSFSALGKAQEATTKYELSLKLAKETSNRKGEGIALNNLGDRYINLGKVNTAIEFYEQALVIGREIGDRRGEGNRLGNMGNCYAVLGKVNTAIEFYEQALVIGREIGDRRGEGGHLSNLGNAYAALGKVNTAIEFYEQALIIRHEIGNRSGEAIDLENIGYAYLSLKKYQKAKECYQQAIQIADDISLPLEQNYARSGLAQAYLFQHDLVNARPTIETALQYDVPMNNHNVTTLHGIITLRQGEVSTAHHAFKLAVVQADEILAKTPGVYEALDAKGLALCGSALCAEDDGSQTVNRGKTLAKAVETFRKARQIAPHAGVVKSVLRLFDELAKCDPEGVLKEVRAAAEGKE